MTLTRTLSAEDGAGPPPARVAGARRGACPQEAPRAHPLLRHQVPTCTCTCNTRSTSITTCISTTRSTCTTTCTCTCTRLAVSLVLALCSLYDANHQVPVVALCRCWWRTPCPGGGAAGGGQPAAPAGRPHPPPRARRVRRGPRQRGGRALDYGGHSIISNHDIFLEKNKRSR